MEIYHWLVVAAFFFTILSSIVAARLSKNPAPGFARLVVLLNVIAALLLLAAGIIFGFSGVEVTITRT